MGFVHSERSARAACPSAPGGQPVSLSMQRQLRATVCTEADVPSCFEPINITGSWLPAPLRRGETAGDPASITLETHTALFGPSSTLQQRTPSQQKADDNLPR